MVTCGETACMCQGDFGTHVSQSHFAIFLRCESSEVDRVSSLPLREGLLVSLSPSLPPSLRVQVGTDDMTIRSLNDHPNSMASSHATLDGGYGQGYTLRPK